MQNPKTMYTLVQTRNILAALGMVAALTVDLVIYHAYSLLPFAVR